MATELRLAPTRRELANRSANGIDVTLTWDSAAGSVAIEVFDNNNSKAKTLPCEPTRP